MSAPAVIPRGTIFRADDITFWAGKEHGRPLDAALDEADLLVSTPHGGSAMPEEVLEFIVPTYTRRLQFDYTDCTTAPICRRWAEIDARIIYVENPHPRLIRDPNRARPVDAEAALREAILRVHAAGPGERVDLTGVDAIRPVSFSFQPVFVISDDETELARLTSAFAEAASRGLEVYESTRDHLRDEMIARALARSAAGAAGPRNVWHLSFHDTMNTTTTPDGAVTVARKPEDELPRIVALSNRGDRDGEPRGADPVVTMPPADVRALADAHRTGFDAAKPDDVQLNKPYLGSQEIIESGRAFDARREDARSLGVRLGAVQAEFRREFLLGPAATAELHRAGTDWPALDPHHVNEIAQACRMSWEAFRQAAASDAGSGEPHR